MTTHTQVKQINKIVGEIISHKTPLTATVKVSSVKVHPKYNKRYMTTKKYHVHDAKDEYKVGDKVEFIPCKPISKTKRFIIVSKV